jgi:hypothetical protein
MRKQEACDRLDLPFVSHDEILNQGIRRIQCTLLSSRFFASEWSIATDKKFIRSFLTPQAQRLRAP